MLELNHKVVWSQNEMKEDDNTGERYLPQEGKEQQSIVKQSNEPQEPGCWQSNRRKKSNTGRVWVEANRQTGDYKS